MLFFGKVLLNIILISTNHNLPQGVVKITMGELVWFIGMQLAIATTSGFSRDDFWISDAERKKLWRTPPYNFNLLMSKPRFNLISKHLSFTMNSPPTYRDKFWRVREMIDEWNRNMAEVFNCSWVVCLDESMLLWLNMWTCPGWNFVLRKPWSMGNEYHSMCCGLSSIMFVIDLVEGRDRPKEAPSLDPQKNGPTVSLLLRMCQFLYTKGTVIILDSGFCVLKGIVELMKKGVYAGACVKKRRYWPKFVKGDAMDSRMKDDPVGTTRLVKGLMDNVEYYFFNLKEPDYTSKIMSTYGCLAEEGDETSRRINGGSKTKHFRYTQVFNNHFAYRHVVDDHNNFRMMEPCIEKSWRTIKWENRVFAFVLTISEVNAWLAMRYFCDLNMKLLDFRINLACQLVYNPWLEKESAGLEKDDEVVNVKKERVVGSI